MFHRSILGIESHNLDLFLSNETSVRSLFNRSCNGHNVAVCEGAMGLYDGVGGSTDKASAWHIADTLDIPVILVVRPKGASLTLAAEIKGLKDFRDNSHIKGIILNNCSDMLGKSLGSIIERETGIPVLGTLPHLDYGEIKSRHLGLYTANEIDDISDRIIKIANELEKHIDVDKLINICNFKDITANVNNCVSIPEAVSIAVARDKAFCFCYKETIEAFSALGAKPIFFSPLYDDKLPENISGLYIPGGYPELYAEELSKNESMRKSIKSAIDNGMPTIAECGGFLYLQSSLADDNNIEHPMVGALNGTGYNYGRLVRFGYADMTAKKDSLLFKKGETIPIHEFHYWESTEIGNDFTSCKPISNRSFEFGYATDSLYAAFPHIYFEAQPKICLRFIKAAEKYMKSNL